MTRIACAAAAAIVTAFVAGFLFGAWCDASDLIEWSDE